MKVSKYINLDANILMEYIYDTNNLLSEPYEILVNTKDNKNSFLSTTSGSLNTLSNQLFLIDPVSRLYGISNTTNYSFLQVNNYSSGYPLRYDTVVIHLPINYAFGNYIGFNLRIYGFDRTNSTQYDLSNFFFDVTNVNTKDYIDYTTQPFIYNETLWGKYITILVPSLNAVSSQVNANITTPNSLNYNLTYGVGMNQLTPIFFEFSFINKSQTINNITTYYLAPKVLANLPQIPEFQKLGVMIQPAEDGDYFEIFGIYNGNIAEFNDWINNAFYLGNNYYVTFTITTYEQNIRGESITITKTNNFNTPITWRPVIKYSSTTAVIDVEMNVIDSVDNSSIIRKASYGMLQDEVSKFSRYLSKINLLNASKPKIYNLKSNSAATTQAVINNVTTVEVPFAILTTAENIIAQSDNSTINGKTFYGDGKLKIVIKPFDTLIKLTIAKQGSGGTASNGVDTSNSGTDLTYMDLSPLGQIQLVFKNTQTQFSFPLYLNNNDVNLQNGVVVFLIPATSVSNLRTIHQSGTNVFYVTATQNNLTTVIYSGLFDMFDSPSNIQVLSQTQLQITTAPAPTATQTTTTPYNSAVLTNLQSFNPTNTTKSNFQTYLAGQQTVSQNALNDLGVNVSFATNSNTNTTTQLKITGPSTATVGSDSTVTYTVNLQGGSWNSSNSTVASLSSQSGKTATFNIKSSGTTKISYTTLDGQQTKNITLIVSSRVLSPNITRSPKA